MGTTLPRVLPRAGEHILYRKAMLHYDVAQFSGQIIIDCLSLYDIGLWQKFTGPVTVTNVLNPFLVIIGVTA